MLANRPTVLIVEDDLDVRATLLRVLAPSYEVTIVDNGGTALWRFESGQRFDVVLCDLSLPRMNGPVLVDHLRQLDPEQARRVIVMTGDAHSPMAAKLADHYVIEKPFDLGELRELVDRVSAAERSGYFPSVARRAARVVGSAPA
jgi:CheY-like chemotaxis protein